MGTITSFAANSLRRRAERTTDSMRERADEAVDIGNNAYDRFSKLLDDLQGLLGRAQKVSGREYESVSRQLSKKLRYAGDALEAVSSDAAVTARRTLKQTSKAVRKRPIEAIGLVAVVGIVIGFLIASSRRD